MHPTGPLARIPPAFLRLRAPLLQAPPAFDLGEGALLLHTALPPQPALAVVPPLLHSLAAPPQKNDSNAPTKAHATANPTLDCAAVQRREILLPLAPSLTRSHFPQPEPRWVVPWSPYIAKPLNGS
uniref:Uncharacterized protein n=1 Tax=Eutreptiella gymnastica TaxID=73025 RepID=A0A7S1HYG2_9EUGL